MDNAILQKGCALVVFSQGVSAERREREHIAESANKRPGPDRGRSGPPLLVIAPDILADIPKVRMEIIPVLELDEIDLEALIAHLFNREAGDGGRVKRLFAIPLRTVAIRAGSESLDKLLEAQCPEIPVRRAHMDAIEKSNF